MHNNTTQAPSPSTARPQVAAALAAQWIEWSSAAPGCVLTRHDLPVALLCASSIRAADTPEGHRGKFAHIHISSSIVTRSWALAGVVIGCMHTTHNTAYTAQHNTAAVNKGYYLSRPYECVSRKQSLGACQVSLLPWLTTHLLGSALTRGDRLHRCITRVLTPKQCC
jgi:hypothetical protein